MAVQLISSKPVTPGPTPELLDRVKAGEHAAFATLVRQHQSYVYALAMRFVRDRTEAEDVVQEVFVRVWRHIGAYRADVKFTTWLYSIVTRLSIDRLRSTLRKVSTFVRYDDGDEVPHDDGHTPVLESLHNARLVEAVGELVVHLPQAQRLVFTLRDLQDLPVDEVALITGMSSTQVKANLWHARQRMRELLDRSGLTEER